MHLSLKMKLAVHSCGNERLITFVDQNQSEYQVIIIRTIPLLGSESKPAEEMANPVFLRKRRAIKA